MVLADFISSELQTVCFPMMDRIAALHELGAI